MKSSAITRVVVMISCLLLSLYYYTIYSGVYTYPKDKPGKIFYTDTKNFLLNTPGCMIPKYLTTMKIEETKNMRKSCGQRAVFIEKVTNDKIRFIIYENRMRSYKDRKNGNYSCCYKFVGPSNLAGKIDYTKIRYSSCKPFNNHTITRLEKDIITVTCTEKSKKNFIYEDAYAMIKKINKTNTSTNRSWNILLIGMDTMSGARVFKSMPKTVRYLKENNWLNFRAYQKVDYNTFPNVAALLTGKNLSSVENACASGLDGCNKLLLWSDFKKAGYATAYGEDFIRLPDTFSRFNGFINKPTDHYLRPLFLTGETDIGNLVCTKKIPSAKHMLDYALNFASLYKDDNFFGFFWSNSFSHNLINNPTLLEDDIIHFFKHLNESRVLDKTFVFFLSDHGVRFGKMRIPYESYYDERLPMLFVWVPKKFQQIYKNEYKNLQIGQNRLITPYDLYLTMWDILKKSNKSKTTMSLNFCPQCSSLFEWISPFRVCVEAGVDDKWCSCYNLTNINHSDPNVQRSIELFVSHLQNKSKSIVTKECTKCALFKVKTILRAHTYKNVRLDKTFYVIALVMRQGGASYEATVVKEHGNYRILEPTHAISVYAANGACATHPNDREYCVCNEIATCKKKD